MNPGKFRHRITFQKRTVVEDDVGNQIETWIDFKSVWSKIITVKGSEYVGAGAERGYLIYRFIIRFAKDVDRTMKIKYKERIFDIIEPPINDDEANKTMTILAKERM